MQINFGGLDVVMSQMVLYVGDGMATVVHVNGPAVAKAILKYAGTLAKSIKSELIIVNVINNRDIEALQKAAMETDAFSVKGWLRRQKEERLRLIKGLI